MRACYKDEMIVLIQVNSRMEGAQFLNLLVRAHDFANKIIVIAKDKLTLESYLKKALSEPYQENYVAQRMDRLRVIFPELNF